ncbi:hypothetical protein VNI00_019290, partial [Paramarasmius palmivorus]
SYPCYTFDHPHPLCRSLQSSAVPRDETPLAARLLAAGREYANAHYGPIKCVAARQTLSMVDNSLFQTPNRQLTREPSWSFIRRFRSITDSYLWLIILQEKGTASRTGEPHAHDLYYPYPYSGLQIVQNNYIRGQSTMKEALQRKASLAPHSAGIIVAFLIRDREGNDVADFIICMDVPDIPKLQFSYFELNPDEVLESRSM